MKRAITGFYTDDEDHWVARLVCGHGQHMRHDPPASDREWVLTEEGRNGKLGTIVECLKCEMKELPADIELIRETPVFTQDTVPKALLRLHTTQEGVWGQIRVREGRLRYEIAGKYPSTHVLDPDRHGVIEPGVEHRVQPMGDVKFSIRLVQRTKEFPDLPDSDAEQ